MSANKTEPQIKNCPSCGAPIISEICTYCHRPTGLNTTETIMEYPVLTCKEAILNFWTLWFPMIFAFAFGLPGVILLMIYILAYKIIVLLLLGIPFLLFSLIASAFIFRILLRYIKVKTCGKIIQSTVYGYMDDTMKINGQPTQIVKLLVQSQDGPRFVLYQLGSTQKPYRINDKIDIKVYKNIFMICNNTEFIQ